MSLILCPECNSKISDKANRCPKCGISGEEIRDGIKRKRKKKNRRNTIILGACGLVVIISFAIPMLIEPTLKYNNAQDLAVEGKYSEAADKLAELGKEDEVEAVLNKAKYEKAKEEAEKGEYKNAIEILELIPDYSDSKELILNYEEEIKNQEKEESYEEAVGNMEKGAYSTALTSFKKLVGFKDSSDKIKECYDSMGDELFEKKQYYDAVKRYREGTLKGRHYMKCCYIAGKKMMDDLQLLDAIDLFEECEGYKDASKKEEKCRELKTVLTGWWYKKDQYGYYYMLYIKFNNKGQLVAFEGSDSLSIEYSYSQRDKYAKSLGTTRVKKVGNNRYTFHDAAGYLITFKVSGANIVVVKGTVQGANDGQGIWKRYFP